MFPNIKYAPRDNTQGDPVASFRADPAGLAAVLTVLAKLATSADDFGHVTVEVREKKLPGGKAITRALVLKLENPAPELEQVTALVMPLVD